MQTFTYTKHDGTEMSREPKGVKVRLAETFRKAGQKLSASPDEVKAGAAGIMQEIGQLTPADLNDFAVLFAAAGYPIAAAVGV